MKKNILNKINLIKKKFKNKEIHLHEPTVLKDDIHSVTRALKNKELSTYGKYTSVFENKISKIVKNKNIVSTINGTSALHLALKVLNVKKDTEVLVPSLTFVSSINAIIYNGAEPHFIDSDPKNLSIDIMKLDKYLNKITFKKRNITFNKKTKKKNKFFTTSSFKWIEL